MKYGYKIFAIVVLIIVAPMIVWMGCGQQQRTPRPADTALQTSLKLFGKKRSYLYDFYHIHPAENRQHTKGVSSECFLLLSLPILTIVAFVLNATIRRFRLKPLF